ncbi:MAG: putative Ig domain-containing protein [Terriglobales bacterium]
MRIRRFNGAAYSFVFALLAFCSAPALAQQGAATGPPLTIKTTNLPKGYLQQYYRLEVHAEGGITPLKWSLTSGALPAGIQLEPDGVLSGVPTQTGEFSFSATLTDSGIPRQHITQEFNLLVVTPLVVRWSRPPKVTATRVDGAIKVSNQTGEDFDLTMVVLAVNENGRATAIGYQHFPLKRNTLDFEIPFGESLPYGAYNVNVDVIAEVASISSIFRGRLMANVRILQAP